MTGNNIHIRSKGLLKKILIHAGFWLLFVLSEYLANRFHYSPEHLPRLWRNIFLSLPVVILPTYFVVLFLVPKYLSQGKIFWFSLWAVMVGLNFRSGSGGKI